MDAKEKQKLADSIKKIMPIVASLKAYQWSKLASAVNYFYRQKAAKVELDDQDLKLLEEDLYQEML